MEYIRLTEFIEKYNFNDCASDVRRLLFDSDWYNDEDAKIYFNVFLMTENKNGEDVFMDSSWVAVIPFDEVGDNDDARYFIEQLDKIYKLIPSNKRDKTYMYELEEIK